MPHAFLQAPPGCVTSVIAAATRHRHLPPRAHDSSPGVAGRRLGVTTRAVAASERSVYEAIQQNSEFPPETTVRRPYVQGCGCGDPALRFETCASCKKPSVLSFPLLKLPYAPHPAPQFPWGFQPPKDFVLPRYSPRAPPSTPTPKQLGYTMPGEFEKHAACWMGWPTSGYLWREGAKPAQEQYAGIAKAISQFEPLKMIASPGAVSEHSSSLHHASCRSCIAR